jgi:hypothetical protein
MPVWAFVIFAVLSVLGVMASQRRASAQGRKPFNKFFWRYRDIEKQLAGGPLPPWLVYALGVVAVVNFTVFFFSCLFLGGEALTGHEAAGHYYLASKGQLTEVSRTVFQYSLWQTRSVFVTHGLAVLVGLVCFKMAKAAQARGPA